VESDDAAEYGDAAFGIGEKLPRDVRLYTAAAVDFQRGEFGGAATRFREVLGIAGAKTALRTTWASYMLGRMHVEPEEFETLSERLLLPVVLPGTVPPTH